MEEIIVGARRWLKNLRLLLIYVMVFVVTPLALSFVIHFGNPENRPILNYLATLMFDFVLFVSFFFIPHKRAKFNNYTEKLLFVLLALITNYALIYLYFYIRM
jgi:hypothetical protein